MKKNDYFDVLTFGSITLDTFVHLCGFDKPLHDKKNFIVPIGEKIPICTAFKSTGGSSINCSMGFKSLGLKVGTFGFVGTDEIGTFILNQIKKQKIPADFITVSKNSVSSFSVVLNTEDGRRSILHYRDPKEDFNAHHLLRAPLTRAVYIGHMYTVSEDMLSAIPKWKKEKKGIVAWNPGKTQFTQGFKKFKKIFPSIDVLILNREESEQFTGLKAKKLNIRKATPEQIGTRIKINPAHITENIYDVRNIAKKFIEGGVSCVIITDGGHGAQLFDKKNHFFAAAPNVKIKSTLGAGDAFSVGVVSSVLSHRPVSEWLVWGTWSSGCVLQELGTHKNLLTISKLKKWMK